MPVIFLTSKDDEIDEVLGLRMGADDYINKPFSQRLLIERIRARAAPRATPASRATATPGDEQPIVRGELMLDPAAISAPGRASRSNLTVTEFLILQVARRSARATSRTATS